MTNLDRIVDALYAEHAPPATDPLDALRLAVADGVAAPGASVTVSADLVRLALTRLEATQPGPHGFGVRVVIAATLQRWRRTVNRREVRHWDRTPLAAPVSGILIGWRTLSDGRVQYDEDGLSEFCPDAHFRAALVATGPHRRPVLVREEDLRYV